jgi:hypothetical protein
LVNYINLVPREKDGFWRQVETLTGVSIGVYSARRRNKPACWALVFRWAFLNCSSEANRTPDGFPFTRVPPPSGREPAGGCTAVLDALVAFFSTLHLPLILQDQSHLLVLFPRAGPGGPAQAWRPAPQIEMLTPKGEHPVPRSTRGMFDGRIRFDGIATPPKTLVVGSYGSRRCKSRKNPTENFGL